MNKLLLIMVLALVGCASQPRAPQATAERHALNVAAAKDLGYEVVTRDGRTLFCSTQAPTGSHVAPGCLTEQQWEQRQLWVWSGPWCPAAYPSCAERNHRLVTVTEGAPY